MARIGGLSTKNAPRPVNAPVGKQSRKLTAEDKSLLLDFVPVVGDIKGAYETVDMIASELEKDDPNYALIGILGGVGAAATIIGLVPGIGDAAQKAIMAGARSVADSASNVGRGALDLAQRIEVDNNSMGAFGVPIKLKPKDDLVGTAVEEGGEAVEQGLRYTESDGALGAMMNKYYSNMNRGSKLTRQGQMQETPLGKIKVNVGRVPLQETGRTIIPPSATTDTQPLTMQQFEQMRENNSEFIPMVWDRSDLGVLKGVNNEPLAFDVPLQAGSQYPTTSSNFEADRLGASHQSVVTKFMNAAKRASGQKVNKKTGEIIEEGKPVYGFFSNMGGESNDFSTMVSDTLLGMMPSSKMTKKSIKEFDETMSKLIKDWPGMDNIQDDISKMEEVRSFLNSPSGGEARKTFVKTMENAKWNNQGFPDVASARAATSVQDMFGMGTGDASGRVIGQIDYNAPTTNITEHGSYPVSIPRVPNTPLYRLADESGAFADIGRDFLLPDYTAARRAAGNPQVSDTRAITMSTPSQPVTAKYIDDIFMELRSQKNRGFPYNR
jgi:hypothetical protein